MCTTPSQPLQHHAATSRLSPNVHHSRSRRLYEANSNLAYTSEQLRRARELVDTPAEGQNQMHVRIFEQIFDQQLERAVNTPPHATKQSAASAKRSGTTLPRVTKVYHCPDDEDVAEETDWVEIRLSKHTTFRDVRTTCARYFGEVAEENVLEDDAGAQWPLGVEVVKEIARYHGEQVIRLVRVTEDIVPIVEEEIEEEGEESGLQDLMQQLGGGAAGGGGNEDEEDVAGQENAANAVDSDSDSDDDGNNKREFVAPPFNRRSVFIELFRHMAFLLLLYFSVRSKRDIPLRVPVLPGRRDDLCGGGVWRFQREGLHGRGQLRGVLGLGGWGAQAWHL